MLQSCFRILLLRNPMAMHLSSHNLLSQSFLSHLKPHASNSRTSAISNYRFLLLLKLHNYCITACMHASSYSYWQVAPKSHAACNGIYECVITEPHIIVSQAILQCPQLFLRPLTSHACLYIVSRSHLLLLFVRDTKLILYAYLLVNTN